MRQIFEVVFPFILPTLIYAGYVAAVRARGGARNAEMPWIWLAAAGALLVIVTFAAAALLGGAPPTDRYVAPKIENGKIVPGQFLPVN